MEGRGFIPITGVGGVVNGHSKAAATGEAF